jgi:DNA polymerase
MYFISLFAFNLSSKSQQEKLKKMCKIMSQKISWAKGLPLGADGYLTPYYKKD